MKRFLRNNHIMLLLAAAVLSLLVGVGSRLLPGRADPVSAAAGAAAGPVRGAVNTVLNWVEALYGNLFRYQDMEGELADLRRQMAGLEEEVRRGREATRENEQLRKLLDLRESRRDFVFESARVTARGAQGWDSTLTLSKGTSAGVAVNNCVITETGALVGVVSQVGPNWATVDTVISPDIELGGQVTRANTAGIVDGELSLMQKGLVRLTYLPLDTDVTEGDEVVTSGLGEVFPSGLVVGTVEQVSPDASGLSSSALVRPAVDLSRLIEVFIIKEFDVVD